MLLFAKSGADDAFRGFGLNPTSSALLAGAFGGLAQTSVMGPCTFLVLSSFSAVNISKSFFNRPAFLILDLPPDRNGFLMRIR